MAKITRISTAIRRHQKSILFGDRKKFQKFHRGDIVEVNFRNIPGSYPEHHHNDAGRQAVVVGSYADQYGGDDTTSYTLSFGKGQRASWYDEVNLDLLEKAHG